MKILTIAFFVVCVSVAAVSAQSHNASKASFEKWVEQANKAQTDNDVKWLEANLTSAYVEGTSFGTWIPKSQLIKDANDPANNKFTKSDFSDTQTEIVGNVGLARFKENYDAVIEGKHLARTIICSMTAVNEGGNWKGSRPIARKLNSAKKTLACSAGTSVLTSRS